MEVEAVGTPSVAVEEVYAAITAAASLDNAVRGAAESKLRTWEGDAVPNFINALISITAEYGRVPEVRHALLRVLVAGSAGTSLSFEAMLTLARRTHGR